VNGERDPQASWPFDPAPGSELDRVLAACRADPNPVTGPAAAFLAFSGAHITVLTGGWRQVTHRNGAIEEWYQDPIDSHAVRGNFIYWRRPKNSKAIPMPLSRRLQGWLPAWLDQDRPMDPSRYNQLFKRAGETISVHVNPLRFRHTCGVLLFHVYGMKSEEIQILLGVTAQTVATYIARPPWAIAKDLLAAGF
jgi:integrase